MPKQRGRKHIIMYNMFPALEKYIVCIPHTVQSCSVRVHHHLRRFRRYTVPVRFSSMHILSAIIAMNSLFVGLPRILLTV